MPALFILTYCKYLYALYFIILSLDLTLIAATSDNPLLTYESLYTDGVNSYLENDWASCVSYMELALNDWHWSRKNVARCRKECYNHANAADIIFPDSPLYQYDRMFERIVVNTLCLVKCKKKVFGSRNEKFVPPEVDKDFELKKPYDYLQLCYFKTGRIEDAANCAATFLVTQPDHDIMQSNIRHYVEMSKLDVDSIVNLELGEYAKRYIEGDKAYLEESYYDAISLIEESLDLFWEALDECRLLCEEPFNQGWHPDFISSVANHFTYTLRCKVKCAKQLSNLYGDAVEDFVPSCFNYLQFSYFQVGKIEKACEAVESFLTLIPEDVSQLRNKQFFWAIDGIKEEYFTPRRIVLEFKEREDKERKLLNYIEESFVFLDNDETNSVESPALEAVDVTKVLSNDSRKVAVQFYRKISKLKIQLLADEQQLKGPARFLAGGFLTKAECHSLTQLIQLASVEGDGYSKRENPHTKSELFLGVTLSRAAMMVHAGYIKPSVLELILNATNFCKDFVQRHFHLEQHLYFSFTHLVCRSSILDPSLRDNSDLSHKIHADNCILQPNGQCLKVPPAYTFRDYSAILYLNEEFEGGEFIFSDDPAGLDFQSKIEPKCGHLVGFSAGKENLHGVKPILRGTRCAVGMWFTLNKKYREAERLLAEKLLVKIKDGEILPGSHTE